MLLFIEHMTKQHTLSHLIVVESARSVFLQLKDSETCLKTLTLKKEIDRSGLKLGLFYSSLFFLRLITVKQNCRNHRDPEVMSTPREGHFPH